MANSYFRFKKFMIHQDLCGMKISTDAVVLGALAFPPNVGNILDIGTGTGVIALMLAQKFPEAEIHGVEIDENAFDQASNNIANSPWKERISLSHETFQEFSAHNSTCFDLIVSNPPYFPAHIKSKDHQRNLALHNDALPFFDLIIGVASILAPTGQFWVILPERQMQDLEKLAFENGLYPQRKVFLKNHPTARILRVIQSFSFSMREATEDTLAIRDQDLNYSPAYKQLLKDFLLDF